MHSVGYRPVTQRVMGWPHGECVRAAYAALLGINIEDIPRFDPAALRGQDQTTAEKRWLKSLGLDLIEIAVPADQSLPQEILDLVPPVEHLMSGLSPRGLYHRVIGYGGQVLWDPHPSRGGLLTCYAIGFIVPRGTELQCYPKR